MRHYGIKCVVDSTFLAKKAEYIIKTSQSLSKEKTQYDAGVETQATSMQQSSEWEWEYLKNCSHVWKIG